MNGRNHIRITIDADEHGIEELKKIAKERNFNVIDITDYHETMTNANVIISNLLEIKHQYSQYKDDEDVYWWYDEYGSDITWQIDCHTVFKDSAPCLNDARGIEYKEDGWDDNCSECKGRWLMEVYE